MNKHTKAVLEVFTQVLSNEEEGIGGLDELDDLLESDMMGNYVEGFDASKVQQDVLREETIKMIVEKAAKKADGMISTFQQIHGL